MSMIKGFKDFIMRGNVVDLAVGIVIGAAFTTVVNSFTNAFLKPLIQLMGGDRSYANLNEIYEELEFAAAIHRRLGCPVVDVSELSIEEIALRIMRAVERRTSAGAAR